MLSVQQVAGEFGCSPVCVYQLVSRGDLPHVWIGVGRGVIRIREADLAGFVARHLHGRVRREERPPRHDLKKLVS